mgnify:CR=1 FL=1
MKEKFRANFPLVNLASTFTSAKDNDLGDTLNQIVQPIREARLQLIEEKMRSLQAIKTSVNSLAKISENTKKAYQQIYSKAYNRQKMQQQEAATNGSDETLHMAAMVELLRDYVGTSWLKKACHFKRHHRAEVLDVLRNVHNGTLNSPDSIINALHEIMEQKSSSLELNFNGSLARRIKFMTEKLHTSPMQAEMTMDAINDETLTSSKHSF